MKLSLHVLHWVSDNGILQPGIVTVHVGKLYPGIQTPQAPFPEYDLHVAIEPLTHDAPTPNAPAAADGIFPSIHFEQAVAEEYVRQSIILPNLH